MLVHISAGRFTRWTVQANRVLPKVSVEPNRRFKNWPAGLLHQHQQHAVSMKRNREAQAPTKQGWRYVIKKVWCLRIFQDQACQMNRITDRLNSIYGPIRPERSIIVASHSTILSTAGLLPTIPHSYSRYPPRTWSQFLRLWRPHLHLFTEKGHGTLGRVFTRSKM